MQRSDGALRLNVRLHVLGLDGVYARNAEGKLEFRALPPPTREEVHRVAERMHGRLERLCAKHGVAGMARDAEVGAEEDSQTALAVCMEAASRDVSLFGERAGERTEKRRVAVRALEGRGAGRGRAYVRNAGLNPIRDLSRTMPLASAAE